MVVARPAEAPAEVSVPRILFMGSFPPRECGIATFTKDVVDSFDRAFHTKSEIIAIDEPGGELRLYGPEVAARLQEDRRESYTDIAAIVNAHPAEVLNIQHEYGLFGGERGEWLVDALRLIEKPVVLTMHTVLPEPDETMLRVTREIARYAAAVVSLSDTGRTLLENVYGIEPERLRVIHHGVPDVPFRPTDAAKATFGVGQRMVISTFGLINRGKGLEYAIEAMRDVVRRHPDALYLILGETHPVVRRQEGESYRQSLQEMVARYGLRNNVQLIDKYLDFDEVVSYLEATDIYLTPYLNPTQIVSGTLAYAVGCGKGDRFDAVLVRAGTARAPSRLLVRFPRLRSDGAYHHLAARRSVVAPRHRTARVSFRAADDVAARRVGVRPAVFGTRAPADGVFANCLNPRARRRSRPSITS